MTFRVRALVLSAVLVAVPVAPASAQAPPVPDPSSLSASSCVPAATEVVGELPWAQRFLAPQLAWSVTRGAGQLVAVIDSGVDGAVPQLVGRVLPGVDVVRGSGTAADDCVGHGTFVAGIIAAQQVPGVAFSGVAPAARILPIRQTSSGSDGTAGSMATSIRVAVDSGAKVINISASAQYGSAELAAAVDYAAAHDVLIVAAASNAAAQGNPKAYPAAYPSVLAVGAIDGQGNRAEFSETGSYLSLVAPGVDILSVGPRGPGHLVGDGTSYAAPFVAGAAALVRAAFPDLSAPQVKHRLEATANHPPAALPDPLLGWGVVDPYAAVTRVLPEEHGQVATAGGPVVVPAAAPPAGPPPAGVAALVVGAAAVLAVLAIGAAAVVVPAGRRRRWRPAEAKSTVDGLGRAPQA
ncbi:type VII secretion-associated serine protease mycosin [Saccharopolyspora sp. 5N708]|uniref:type VII secretion-associated serine protease mycosin n=1 Tax=Saccharopolyspora sp. 5N708 TaxID=3457424 RepID=UPI003FD32BBC